MERWTAHSSDNMLYITLTVVCIWAHPVCVFRCHGCGVVPSRRVVSLLQCGQHHCDLECSQIPRCQTRTTVFCCCCICELFLTQPCSSSPPEIVASLKGHTGLVKGLTWDPVGKYIASQADDHSLKVWRTMDWQQETNITKPFNEVSSTLPS